MTVSGRSFIRCRSGSFVSGGSHCPISIRRALRDKRRMISLHPIADPAGAMRRSPMLRAVCLTLNYIAEHGPIGLTATGALKRYIVEWAVDSFDWPFYTAADLYAVNKVLNERDFPPLAIMHDVLLSAKLARHKKGALHITRLAEKLRSDPAALWALLARRFLFATDHTGYTRFGDRPIGNWDIFLNVINVEAQQGVSEDWLCHLLYAPGKTDGQHDDIRIKAALFIHVLRPLCWMGLLEEVRSGAGFKREEHYFKTEIWREVFKLDTDIHLDPVTHH